MIDDGETYNNPVRLDIVFDFTMPDNEHGILKFSTKSVGYKSEATKLGKLQFLGADQTNAYKIVNAQIKDGDKFVGKYGSDKVLEFDFGGVDLDTIEQIEFSS